MWMCTSAGNIERFEVALHDAPGGVAGIRRYFGMVAAQGQERGRGRFCFDRHLLVQAQGLVNRGQLMESVRPCGAYCEA